MSFYSREREKCLLSMLYLGLLLQYAFRLALLQPLNGV